MVHNRLRPTGLSLYLWFLGLFFGLGVLVGPHEPTHTKTVTFFFSVRNFHKKRDDGWTFHEQGKTRDEGGERRGRRERERGRGDKPCSIKDNIYRLEQTSMLAKPLKPKPKPNTKHQTARQNHINQRRKKIQTALFFTELPSFFFLSLNVIQTVKVKSVIQHIFFFAILRTSDTKQHEKKRQTWPRIVVDPLALKSSHRHHHLQPQR